VGGTTPVGAGGQRPVGVPGVVGQDRARSGDLVGAAQRVVAEGQDVAALAGRAAVEVEVGQAAVGAVGAGPLQLRAATTSRQARSRKWAVACTDNALDDVVAIPSCNRLERIRILVNSRLAHHPSFINSRGTSKHIHNR
jgi:hypothetical protein